MYGTAVKIVMRTIRITWICSGKISKIYKAKSHGTYSYYRGLRGLKSLRSFRKTTVEASASSGKCSVSDRNNLSVCHHHRLTLCWCTVCSIEWITRLYVCLLSTARRNLELQLQRIDSSSVISEVTSSSWQHALPFSSFSKAKFW
jgi:hypothetical protein